MCTGCGNASSRSRNASVLASILSVLQTLSAIIRTFLGFTTVTLALIATNAS